MYALESCDTRIEHIPFSGSWTVILNPSMLALLVEEAQKSIAVGSFHVGRYGR